MQSKLGATVAIMEFLPIEDVDKDTIQDYEKLNDRCDQVITKIQDRKKGKKETKKKNK